MQSSPSRSPVAPPDPIPIPDPASKQSLLVETVETLLYRVSKEGSIVKQVSKILSEQLAEITSDTTQFVTCIFQDLTQNIFLQLFDAILQDKDRKSILTHVVTIITPDLMTPHTLSLLCSSMLSILPYSSGGILPIILTSFNNLSKSFLHEEVYSLLISTLFDLHLVLLPNAQETAMVKDLIKSFLVNAPLLKFPEGKIPPVVSLLTTVSRYAVVDWCSPDAVRTREILDNKYQLSIDIKAKIKNDAEKHREEKMKYVKGLSEENKKYTTSRAHAHAVKCILMVLSEADHTQLQSYDMWKQPIVDCLIDNGFTTEPQKYIPAVKIFVEIMSSPILHLKGLSVVLDRLYLFVLNSQISTSQQKQLTLEMLVSLTEKSECVLSMFKLYDCNYKAPNVVYSLIKTLSDVVDGKMKSNEKYVSKQFDIDNRMRALKCILNIIDGVSETIASGIEYKKEGIEAKIDRKVMLEQGIQIFNKEYIEGINFFVRHSYCKDNKKDIAEFLLTTPGVDKRKMTEYLTSIGKEVPEVLNNLMKDIDFTGERFDDALQRMFRIFCTPGEVHIVDNIIPRFAERYVECNQSLHLSIEDVSLLTTSVIGIAMDTSNKEMTLKKFQEMVSGIKGDVDIEGLYKRASSGMFAVSDWLLGVKRDNTEDLEMKEQMLRTMSGIDTNMLKIRKTEDETFSSITSELVEMFLRSVTSSCCDIFRKAFFNEETGDFVENSLKGMQKLIHCTSILKMSESDDLLSELSLWTVLLTPEMMRAKHVLAIRYIIQICKDEGMYILKGWVSCLKVISHLDHLNLLPKPKGVITELKEMPKNERDIEYIEYLGCFTFVNNDLRISNKQFDPKTLTTLKSFLQKQIGVMNDIFAKEAVASKENFFCFLNAMKTVVLSEINTLCPQMFLFTMLLHVLLMCVGRERSEIDDIIQIATEVYTKAGLHPHEVVSVEAVKALGMLHDKFYKNDDIINSLIVIMADSPIEKVREEVMKTITDVLEKHDVNKHINWTGILHIINLAGKDRNPVILKLGFSMLQMACTQANDTENKALVKYGLALFSRKILNEKMARDVIDMCRMYLKEDTTPEDIESGNLEIMYALGGVIGSQRIECGAEAMGIMRNLFDKISKIGVVEAVFDIITPQIYFNIENKEDWITPIGMTFALHLLELITSNKADIENVDIILNVIQMLAVKGGDICSSVNDILMKEVFEVMVGHQNCVLGTVKTIEFLKNHITSVILLQMNSKIKTPRKICNADNKCSTCKNVCTRHTMLPCLYCNDHVFCSEKCRKKFGNHKMAVKHFEYNSIKVKDLQKILALDLKIVMLLYNSVSDIVLKCNVDTLLDHFVNLLDDFAAGIGIFDKILADTFNMLLESSTKCFISFVLESQKFERLNDLFKLDIIFAQILCDSLIFERNSVLSEVKKSLDVSKLPTTANGKKLATRLLTL
ncbi:guanyl-nucleotide exchange factor, putative [Entamoeba invadens IP1]|uniref:Guanyl-nucleotide exchange factor, putative n=1 Tax=Entamoeba invadens IP1 TaxID=370355 RepID=A0A0A1TWG4_ENTIV|nr:guanyl-nucleotide exchange factor, putative [Entamoeba invadens IP1]ELP83673.1 guanyl-nucleotide exchange factor, putative [Entamoeba invadens IP1]|eukprot:XP_004183019.1 guanyl-nucleotide exchange factor, putative [Entamoeba invadens IP1]